MKSIVISALALATITVMSSCKSSKQAGTNASNSGSEALYQNEWKLTELQGEAVATSSTAGLLFTSGKPNRVSGNTGCNRLNGSFELTGTNTIKFSPVATTRMACMDAKENTTEQKFTDALSKAGNWRIDNGVLLLQSGENIVAKFIAQKTYTAAELQLNGTWELNYLSGPKITLDGLFPEKKPILIFDLPKEEATGNGGCNGYSAPVKVNGSNISFGDGISTMMACEGNGEPIYLKALKTITAYSITDNNTLHLIMGDIAVMKFVRK